MKGPGKRLSSACSLGAAGSTSWSTTPGWATSPIEETTLAGRERTVAIDQTGVFLGMKSCAEALKASGHGPAINISSIFGTSGGFGTSPAHHAAKGAVRTLTKNVPLHWATEGVRVNSVHPGFIAR